MSTRRVFLNLLCLLGACLAFWAWVLHHAMRLVK